MHVIAPLKHRNRPFRDVVEQGCPLQHILITLTFGQVQRLSDHLPEHAYRVLADEAPVHFLEFAPFGYCFLYFVVYKVHENNAHGSFEEVV